MPKRPFPRYPSLAGNPGTVITSMATLLIKPSLVLISVCFLYKVTVQQLKYRIAATASPNPQPFLHLQSTTHTHNGCFRRCFQDDLPQPWPLWPQGLGHFPRWMVSLYLSSSSSPLHLCLTLDSQGHLRRPGRRRHCQRMHQGRLRPRRQLLRLRRGLRRRQVRDLHGQGHQEVRLQA